MVWLPPLVDIHWLTVLMLGALLEPLPQPDGAHLARDLERMQESARVLYVAAHPDDENTQFLGYMANDRGWRAAYLSLTRGEGGQNAIGDELVHGLGLIRTWELLTARRTDGAEQYITRQRDFGYSKSAEETLDVWGADQALADTVWTIRRFRPNVIVTRFPEEGTTHGHHLASAQLAREAFGLAGDPDAFPEQLEGPDAVATWQPTRLLYNVPLRWMGGEIQDEWYTVDLGTYDELLGRSYNELSATSRSLHRSQAFGSTARRGPDVEAFELLEGEAPAGEDPFEDIPSGWAPQSERVASLLQNALEAFDVRAPSATIPTLLDAHAAAGDLDPVDAADLRQRIETWVVQAAGLHLDARVESAFVAPGDAVTVTVDALARADGAWALDGVTLRWSSDATTAVALDGDLPEHELRQATATVAVPADEPVTTPYWLRDTPGVGAYAVGERVLLGAPVGPPSLTAVWSLRRGNVAFEVETPVRAVPVDSTLGERVQPLTVLPPLTVEPEADVLLLPNGATTALEIEVSAHRAVADASVTVAAPEGWTVTPTIAELTLDAGARETLRFEVEAPPTAAPGALSIVTTADGRSDGWTRQTIDYPHLPPLTMLLPAVVQAAPLEWTPPSQRVGYVMGPGDAVASALSSAGVDVTLLDDDTLRQGDLDAWDTIVIGVRAFHEREPLRTHTDRLWAFAERGGTVLVQYQTNNWSQRLTVDVGPSPITIGRGRVTVEQAPITWLPAADGLRNGLHTLGDADFDGWVQERGLYFAEEWDDAWTPMMELNDPGEDPLQGALLVHEHGDGAVIYCGLSLFRQLPAGVPGAYRLLANLIAHNHAD